MRVISGQVRGLKLISPSGLHTRPTLDRVKEAVFSMLTPFVGDSMVLDLFAGSGALGIEALSRGAKKAVFIDNSEDCIKCIKQNIASARMEQSSVAFKIDALSYLKNCNEKFNLIFLDPPYLDGVYGSVLDLIRTNKLLDVNGLIVVEWDYETGFSDDLCGFEIFRDKKYGRVGITLLKRSFT